MKRILYSCLILLSICITSKLHAQPPSFSITANPQCYNALSSYQSTASIVGPNPGADSYSWTVITSNTTTCAPSFTPYGIGAAPVQSNVSVAIDIPCCGDYTVVCLAMLNGFPIAPVPQNTLFSGGYSVGVIYCPNGASVTPSTQNICIGSVASLTAAVPGATAWAWSSGQTTSVIAVSPSVNTCYNFTATTASGCTVTALAPGCVSVQAMTATASPASQSMCAGSPVSFTANANVVSNGSVTPGTIITGYQWYNPVSGAIGTGTTVTDPLAQGGPYSVVVTHTGAAGTCTVSASANVVITTSIPVTLTPSSFSVCPNGCLTLTAVSIQTVANSYTWTQSAGAPGTFTGNPAVRCPGPATFPRDYTVNVDYFGCPGTASVTIGLLTLTPTLTSSALTSCPGRSLTLTATGGLTYSFSATPFGPPNTPTAYINKATANTPSVVHIPAASDMPIQYCVSTASTGCTGTTCIVVNTRTLTPTLTASSPSICNGTQFTLTASGSGVQPTGTTFTFSSGYSTNIGTINPVTHNPGANILPQIYSVVVDSAGCTGTATLAIGELTLNPILSSSSPSICPGSTVTLNSTGGAGTQYTFSASHPQFDLPTSTVQVTFGNSFVTHTPTPISPVGTVFNYTVAVDSSGCKGIGTHSVGILDLGPTLTLSTLPASGSVCPGSTITIQALGSINYTFTSPPSNQFATYTATSGNATAFATTTVPLNIPLAGLVYTVTADSAQCAGTKTILVNEFKLNPSISASPTLVCSGVDVTLTTTGVLSGLGVNYTFYSVTPTAPTPASLTSAAGSFSTIVNPTIQTIYSVVVDSLGCTSILPPPTVTVDIKPDLPLVPSTSAASVCPGISTTLSVLAPTTALTYTYNWFQITGTGQLTPPVNTQSVVAYPTSNSNYSVNVIDSLGCVGNTVITVGIDPGISFPILLSSSGNTICQITGQPPQSVTLTAANAPTLSSLGTINYTWTPITGLSPTNIGTTVTASPSLTTLYTVLGDNGYGCVAQNSISVYVGQVPNTLTATSVYNTICPGFTSTLTASGANTYSWTGPPTSFTGTIGQQSISVGVPGTYTVLGSNGGGCTFTAMYSISQGTPLTIIPTQSSPTTCIMSNSPKFSKPVQLTATGAGSYVWFPYNPIHMTYSLGPTTHVRPPVTTIYTVVGTSPNCAGTGTVLVNVIPQFSINVTPPIPAMCLGDSLLLTITGIGSQTVGPVSALTYSWTEALNAPPISISGYFTPTVMVYPQNTTTYTTEVRDSRECISFPKLVTVTVLPQPLTAISIPTINSVATNTVCYVGLNPGALDVTINLTGNNMNTGLQFGIVPTYTWISPYTNHVSILTPANNNAITVSAPIRELDSSSVVVYTLISGYNGVQGCKRIDTVSVRVVDCRPVRTITFTTVEKADTICARNCITFINQTDTMAGGPQTYTWTFRGGSPAVSHEQNPTICYNFPGSYDVILQVANPYPVINTTGAAPGSTFAIGTRRYVNVVDIPNVTIIAPGQVRSDTTVRFGQSVNLNATGARSYEWAPSYNISSLSKPKVTVSPFKTTQYVLTGYNSKGCLSSDTINVIVVEDCGEMYVPNAFTPNNDGNNDVLYVRGICLQSLTFMIFNRWGEKVFETADQSIGWDGTYKGEDLNTGVFVYRLEGKTYDGKGFSLKGNITLLR